MGEIDRTYEFQDEPRLMTSEQVEYLQSRIYNIIATTYTGFTMSSHVPDHDALTWSQMMLSDLLTDLSSDQATPSSNSPDTSQVYQELPRYALIPISAIAGAPNLAHHQKTKLLSEYPDLLYMSEFTLTQHGARALVARELRMARYTSPDKRGEYTDVLKAVEHRWRLDRLQKTLDHLGEFYKRNPHLIFFR